MKHLKIFCAVWLILAHLQLEIAPILEKRKPVYANEFINPFLSPTYKFPSHKDWPEGKLPRKWWVKYCCNDLYRVMVFFVLTMIAFQYSFLLGRVAGIFFLYQVADHILLWWNYRSSGWHYYFINGVIILCILSMFLPEKKTGKLKSLT